MNPRPLMWGLSQWLSKPLTCFLVSFSCANLNRMQKQDETMPEKQDTLTFQTITVIGKLSSLTNNRQSLSGQHSRWWLKWTVAQRAVGRLNTVRPGFESRQFKLEKSFQSWLEHPWPGPSNESGISNNNVKVYFISMKSLQFAEKYTIQASGDIREIGQKRSGSRKLIWAKLKSAKREPKNISAENNCHLAKSDLIKR